MVRLAQAVFKGGGVKGIALVGALAVAEERGWRWRAVAGTSAGALVAALVAAGYGAEALRRVVHDLDLRSFADPAGWKVASLLLHEGIFKGEKLLAEVERLLSERLGRPRVTFRDLPVACQIVATDLTHRRMLVFPHDLARPPYGLEDPYDFPVADAVRASTAIPFFFQPYRLELPNGVRATLVDGGLLSNFPVHLFQPVGGPAYLPTFGFDLRGGDDELQPTDTPLELVQAMVNTILSARDLSDLENQRYVRTIPIDTAPYRTTQFDLDAEDKEALYQRGRAAAEAFFADPATVAWLQDFAVRRALRPLRAVLSV
ncbi:NTE family protein [Symbiobacterium terraclitae]|uniref:NTE family protein n=1 Tax=Symbiobacterium terraclitae TaxID=557451 RepID=A0ABS4JQ68_9FIRM|nr:patatin-like phospholipase family protein [Symbiobacterium terraclitae]MBP2017681.1 NTE family protein [Symbiobacterium terraclitae]